MALSIQFKRTNMSIGTGYIYNQRGDVVLTNRTGTTRNIHSNYKPFVAYKGFDTKLTFFIYGEDGNPVQLQDKQIVATALKHNTHDVAFTTTLTNKTPESGKCELIISADDIYDSDSGLYSLVLTYTDLTGSTSTIYMNKDKRVEYVLEINDDVLPSISEPTELTTFNLVTPGEPELLSNVFAGSAQSEKQAALNTFALYTADATGTVIIEATLDSNSASTEWFQLDPVITLTSSTGTFAYTYEGNFVWLRIRTNISSGTIDKISYLY